MNGIYAEKVEISGRDYWYVKDAKTGAIIAAGDTISTAVNNYETMQKNKEMIANKLKKSEDSRNVLIAKKSLLDSIESIKGLSTNVFENQDFDIDNVMKEIDQSILDIETELQANDELNDLIK